jgi:hypothetical protein
MKPLTKPLRGLRIDYDATKHSWVLEWPDTQPFTDKLFPSFGDAQDFAASQGYQALLAI